MFRNIGYYIDELTNQYTPDSAANKRYINDLKWENWTFIEECEKCGDFLVCDSSPASEYDPNLYCTYCCNCENNWFYKIPKTNEYKNHRLLLKCRKINEVMYKSFLTLNTRGKLEKLIKNKEKTKKFIIYLYNRSRKINKNYYNMGNFISIFNYIRCDYLRKHNKLLELSCIFKIDDFNEEYNNIVDIEQRNKYNNIKKHFKNNNIVGSPLQCYFIINHILGNYQIDPFLVYKLASDENMKYSLGTYNRNYYTLNKGIIKFLELNKKCSFKEFCDILDKYDKYYLNNKKNKKIDKVEKEKIILH